MKRQTAVGHLVEAGEVASGLERLRLGDAGSPLRELWVAGDLLTLADPVEAMAVVLVLDLPVAELPWLARHPTGEWVGERLRLAKRPLSWCYRPHGWPAWNVEHRRVVRVWTADDGLDGEVTDALRSRRLDHLTVVEPSPEAFETQVRAELVESRRHLRDLLEHYWEHDWRRTHRGPDESPDDHLWRAAYGVSDLLEAIER